MHTLITIRHQVNKSIRQYVSKSFNHQICNSMLTDRLVQILDFGEVSTDRQVLSRVTRKVLSNSKHNLLSSDTSISKSSQSLKPRCLLGERKRG